MPPATQKGLLPDEITTLIRLKSDHTTHTTTIKVEQLKRQDTPIPVRTCACCVVM